MEKRAGPSTRRQRRAGPRPLPLHLAVQILALATSRAALPNWNSGSPTWKPAFAEAANALRRDLAGVEADAFTAAVDREAQRRLAAFAQGIVAYRRHPAGRSLPEPTVVWQEGTTRLLDFGAGGDGPPVLFVPSLINRAYILDLAPNRSLLRALAADGLRPLLVDWAAPGAAERDFDLSDYVAGRLESALDAACRLTGRPAAAAGYCMGGLLALALAQRRPDSVAALVLMATPWDFHAGPQAPVRYLRSMAPVIEETVARLGMLPVDVLQAMFMSLDPFLADRKFRRFAGLAAESSSARLFVALEDWLNDGVPLVAGVARECLFGWYGDNTPAEGRWTIGGRPVLPAEVTAPTLLLVPEQDRIVPPGSALPLASALPAADCRMVGSGHIGMVAGSRAETVLYRPLSRWLSTTAI